MRELGGVRVYPANRLNNITDGVIAVALTLLVLDVELPMEGQELAPLLLGTLPRIELWLASFIVVAGLWVFHYGWLGHRKEVDSLSVVLRVSFLAGVSLVPFIVTVVADYPDRPLALQVFWGLIGYTGVILAFEVVRDRRRSGGLSSKTLIQLLVLPASAALGILLAPVHTRLALWTWLPLALVAFWIVREDRDRAPVASEPPGDLGDLET